MWPIRFFHLFSHFFFWWIKTKSEHIEGHGACRLSARRKKNLMHQIQLWCEYVYFSSAVFVCLFLFFFFFSQIEMKREEMSGRAGATVLMCCVCVYYRSIIHMQWRSTLIFIFHLNRYSMAPCIVRIPRPFFSGLFLSYIFFVRSILRCLPSR